MKRDVETRQLASPDLGTLDPLMWAKQIKSQTALNFLRKGCAEGDSRLQEIVRQHISDGICTEDGKLLRRWEGLQWVSV